MTLTLWDLLVLFLLGLLVHGAFYGIVMLRQLQNERQNRQHHEAIEKLLRQHPRFPFNLPVVETMSAGEYVCDHCGTTNYFSLIRLAPEQLPPGELRDLARQDEENGPKIVDMGQYRSVMPGGVYTAPLVLRCCYCHGLSANGEAMKLMKR